jgi:hypothetical protein
MGNQEITDDELHELVRQRMPYWFAQLKPDQQKQATRITELRHALDVAMITLRRVAMDSPADGRFRSEATMACQNAMAVLAEDGEQISQPPLCAVCAHARAWHVENGKFGATAGEEQCLLCCRLAVVEYEHIYDPRAIPAREEKGSKQP